MDNLRIYNAVRAVPKDAQKPIKGGRLNGFTDISPMWRIKTLTKQFGPCGIGWSFRIVNMELLPLAGNGEQTAQVVIELKYRDAEAWSEPVTGIGGSMHIAMQKGKPYVDDECYKKALTDAIGNAAKNLGVGADIYWDADRTKYTVPEPQEQAPPADGKRKLATDLIRIANAKGYSSDDVLAFCKVDRLSSLTLQQIKNAIASYDMMEDNPNA